MKWTVKGAQRDTGADITIEIEADNQASAERRAGRQGIVVEWCEASAASQDVEALAEAVLADVKPQLGAIHDDSMAGTAVAVPPPKASAIDYAGPTTPAPTSTRTSPGAITVPEYGQIVTGARVINGYAYLLLALAVLGFAVGAIHLFLAITESGLRGADHKDMAIVTLLTSIGLLLAAALVRMVASLALAVRDIARNSFTAGGG